MKHGSEKVMLYQFTDEARLESISNLFKKLNIPVEVLPQEAWREKIGYLLGNPGFSTTKHEEESFAFNHEVMVMQGIRNKRLDQVLEAFRTAAIPPVLYKAIVTPFNTLWTLKKLCLTIEKEHGMVTQAKK